MNLRKRFNVVDEARWRIYLKHKLRKRGILLFDSNSVTTSELEKMEHSSSGKDSWFSANKHQFNPDMLYQL